MGELLNCRWCNGEPERVGVWPWGQTVRCKTCFASGPHKQTSEEADSAWNTRSGSQGVVDDGALERACAAYDPMWDCRLMVEKQTIKERMRAALLAAMGGRGKT